MKVIKKEYTKDIGVAAGVARWNYWDLEHLVVVHKNYESSVVLFEDKDMVVHLLTFRIPFFCLTSNALSCFVQVDDETQVHFNQGLFGIPSVSTINIRATGENSCQIRMRYQFFLRGWTKLLAPLMYCMMGRWNERVWLEDLPLKLRRQKVIRAGFRDFVGMPTHVKDRHHHGPIDCKLPVARPAGSPVDMYKAIVSDR